MNDIAARRMAGGGRPTERPVVAALHQADPAGWVMADRGDLLLGPGGGFRSHDSMIARARPLRVGPLRETTSASACAGGSDEQRQAGHGSHAGDDEGDAGARQRHQRGRDH